MDRSGLSIQPDIKQLPGCWGGGEDTPGPLRREKLAILLQQASLVGLSFWFGVLYAIVMAGGSCCLPLYEAVSPCVFRMIGETGKAVRRKDMWQRPI